jgi:hypothetical protein
MPEYKTKDEQRAAVLEYYYRFNEQYPGGCAQTSQVVNDIGLEPRAVLEAQQYLVDKYMLASREEGQQIRGMGQPGVRAFIARITASGVDFVEHPEEWKGNVPDALIKIVARNVNYAAGDQQIVQGDVSGILAQGSATVTLPAFPIAELRASLAGNSEALAAVDSIDAELKAPKPMWAKIAAAAEIVKVTAKAGDAAQSLYRWLAEPSVSHAIAHGIHSILSL